MQVLVTYPVVSRNANSYASDTNVKLTKILLPSELHSENMDRDCYSDLRRTTGNPLHTRGRVFSTKAIEGIFVCL